MSSKVAEVVAFQGNSGQKKVELQFLTWRRLQYTKNDNFVTHSLWKYLIPHYIL